jgi:hypothetical protein
LQPCERVSSIHVITHYYNFVIDASWQLHNQGYGDCKWLEPNHDLHADSNLTQLAFWE